MNHIDIVTQRKFNSDFLFCIVNVFGRHNKDDLYGIEITVLIKPDPPVTGGEVLITISGTLTSGTINQGSTLIIEPVDTNGKDIGTPSISDFCTGGITCPLSPGTSFSKISKLMVTTLPP